MGQHWRGHERHGHPRQGEAVAAAVGDRDGEEGIREDHCAGECHRASGGDGGEERGVYAG